MDFADYLSVRPLGGRSRAKTHNGAKRRRDPPADEARELDRGPTPHVDIVNLVSDEDEAPAPQRTRTSRPPPDLHPAPLFPSRGRDDGCLATSIPDTAMTTLENAAAPKSKTKKIKDIHGVEDQHAPSSVPESAGAIATRLPDAAVAREGRPARGEPALCPEQLELVELIASGRNVFYTGSAGCGKSTVLKAFTRKMTDMGKKVQIVAPTGRAALQVNGLTTWTYAGWGPDSHKRSLGELCAAAHGQRVWKRFTETDVLVIDEVSMIENLHFARLNEVMKAARHKPHVTEQPAFGGVQLVVTGDFCQLPPVKPFQYCITCGRQLRSKKYLRSTVYTCPAHGDFHDEDKWAFRSKAWEECNFVHFHLKTIHRQNDEEFIRLLQKCRLGIPYTSDETDRLMNHPCKTGQTTRLFATRNEVNRHNAEKFGSLRTKPHAYACLDTFNWRPEIHPELQWKDKRNDDGSLVALNEHRFEREVQLKVGMLVVLLVNLDLPARLCNGSQGVISGFETYSAQKLPKAPKGRSTGEVVPTISGEHADLKEAQIRAFIERAAQKVWPVVKFHNGETRTIMADCTVNELGDQRPYSLLSRTQIPLMPAWAMSIHKSQSLTLDRVVVNVSRAFEEGQVYVALSRATCLDGLKVEGNPDGLNVGKGGNPQVQQFLREKFPDMWAGT